MLRVVRDDGGSGGERSEPERRLRLVVDREAGGEERKECPAPPFRGPAPPDYDDAA